MKNPARPQPSRARRLTDRGWQPCPRPTHRKPPVHPYQKRTAKLRRLRWTQATAIGIPLQSPLQPPSVSTVVARKADQQAPVGVDAPQLQVWRWLLRHRSSRNTRKSACSTCYGADEANSHRGEPAHKKRRRRCGTSEFMRTSQASTRNDALRARAVFPYLIAFRPFRMRSHHFRKNENQLAGSNPRSI
jgi:hypothetical protein